MQGEKTKWKIGAEDNRPRKWQRRLVLSCSQSLNFDVGSHRKATGTETQERALHPVYFGQCLVPTLPIHVAGKVSLLCVVHKQYFGSAHVPCIIITEYTVWI